MNLIGSRLLEAVSKGMLSETSQLFLWTHKGLRFIYCFKELVVSSLERWETVRGNTCSAVLTFEMPSVISLCWWLISQHKRRGSGSRTDARLCIQSCMCFICGRRWNEEASVGVSRGGLAVKDVLSLTSCVIPSSQWDRAGQGWWTTKLLKLTAASLEDSRGLFLSNQLHY